MENYFIMVYGKPNNLQTLNNNGYLNEPFEFSLQKNIIYKGKVDVINNLLNMNLFQKIFHLSLEILN